MDNHVSLKLGEIKCWRLCTTTMEKPPISTRSTSFSSRPNCPYPYYLTTVVEQSALFPQCFWIVHVASMDDMVTVRSNSRAWLRKIPCVSEINPILISCTEIPLFRRLYHNEMIIQTFFGLVKAFSVPHRSDYAHGVEYCQYGHAHIGKDGLPEGNGAYGA